MKIRQQPVNRPEFITRRDRQIRRVFFGDKFSVFRERRFQSSRRRRADGDYPAIFGVRLVQNFRRFRRNFVIFRQNFVFR